MSRRDCAEAIVGIAVGVFLGNLAAFAFVRLLLQLIRLAS